MPFTGGATRGARQASSSHPRSRRTRSSVNSALIAGVGTLLLAMAVGVLIGRSGSGAEVRSAGSPTVQVVTAPAAAGAATSSAEPQAQASTAGPPGSKGTSGASAAKSTGVAAKKNPPAPAKTVKVGSPGKGAGYQKGHFTGNFFGE